MLAKSNSTALPGGTGFDEDTDKSSQDSDSQNPNPGSQDSLPRLRTLWMIESKDVVISAKIAGAFKQWKNDPHSFLRPDRSWTHGTLSWPAKFYEYTWHNATLKRAAKPTESCEDF